MAEINNILGQVGSGSNQDNKFLPLYLKAVGFNDEGINPDYLAYLLNTSPLISVGQTQILLITAQVKAYDDEYQVDYSWYNVKYVLNGKGKGVYGVGGTQVVGEDINVIDVRPLTYQDIVSNPTTQTITFGEIGNTSVSNYLNAQNPAIVVQGQAEGYVVFETISNGLPINYLFTGQGGTYGLGQAQSSDVDFEVLSSAYGLQDLQSVVNVGKTADKIELKHLGFQGGTFLPSGTSYTVFSDPSVTGGYFIYGNFDSYNGGVSKDIIKVKANGLIDNSFNSGVGFNSQPYGGARIVEAPSGNVYIAGSFTTYNNISANRIIGLNANGSINTAFNTGSGLNNFGLSIGMCSDESMYITGLFTQYDGVDANRIIKVLQDGSIDPLFLYGTGFNNTSIDTHVMIDDSVYITGYFSSYKGLACHNMIKLLHSGDIDISFNVTTGFNTGVGQPNYVFGTPDNKLIISGYFTSFNGISRNRVLKLNLDGTEDPSFVVGTGFDDNAKVRYSPTLGKYIGYGAFTSYNGVASNGTIILNLDGSIYKTFTNRLSSPIGLSDGSLIGMSTSGPLAYTLVKDLDDSQINSIVKVFSFDEFTGKAEYSITELADTSDQEILPKILIEQLISEVSPPTNLDYIPAPGSGTVTSSTGTDATIPLADSVNAGLLGPDVQVIYGEKTFNTGTVIFNVIASDSKKLSTNTSSWIFQTTGDIVPDFVINEYGISIRANSNQLDIDGNLLTATRILQAPDNSGIIALTSDIPSDLVTGGGTTNYVAKWLSNGVIDNSQIFDNGNRVLIGTTTDNLTDKLQVNGTGLFSSDIKTNTSLKLKGSSSTYFKISATSDNFGFSNPAGNLLAVIDSDYFFLYNALNFDGAIVTDLLTGSREYRLPDKSGIFALTSDITSSISGTTNKISKFTSANTIGNSQIEDNGSRVWIGGVDNTIDKLQVSGTISASAATLNNQVVILSQLAASLAPYQLVSNMQDNWNADPTGEKYPQFTIVKNTLTTMLEAFGTSGFVSSRDSVALQDISTTVLRVTANDYPAYFSAELNTGIISDSIKLFPQQDFPLASIPGITVDGIYLRYVAYLADGSLNFSNQSFSQDDNYVQIGRIALKRVAGVVTFIDTVGSPRNVKTTPDLAGNSNLTRLYSPLSSDVELEPNANMTMNHLGGFVSGASINWGAANINYRTVLAQNPVQFARIDPSVNTSTTAPPVVTTLVVNNYWNGTALVAVPNNGNATVQRVLISDNGAIHIQAGEVVYDNFSEAKDAFSTAPFTEIVPKASYVEIGRIVAVKTTTDLSNEADCQFYATSGIGGGGGSASAGTDIGVVLSANQALITSSTGLDGALPLASATLAGLLSPTEKIKLDTVVTGIGTANRIAKFTDADTLGDSQIEDNGARVWIGGTDNGVDAFQVAGQGYFAGALRIGTVPSGIAEIASYGNMYSQGGKFIFSQGNLAYNDEFIGYLESFYAERTGLLRFQGTLANEGYVISGEQFGTETALWAKNVEVARLKSTGAFLIGTTTDNGVDKLQVNGTIVAIGSSQQVILNGEVGTVTIKGLAGGGWDKQYNFKGDVNQFGGFGANGYLDNLTQYYIGNSYVNPSIVIHDKVLGTGNVLINTNVDNGVDKLQVNGNVNATKVKAYRFENGNNGDFGIKSLFINDINGPLADDETLAYIGNFGYANNPLSTILNVSLSGNQSSIKVKGTGNVLIADAIDNGFDKLQVNGSIKASGNLSGGNLFLQDLLIVATDTFNTYFKCKASGGFIFAVNNGAEFARFNDSGNFLINTNLDNGVDKLQVNGSAYVIKEGAENGITVGLTLKNSYNYDNSGLAILFDSFFKQAVIRSKSSPSSTSGGSLFLQTYFDNATLNNGIEITRLGNVLINTPTDNGVDKLQVNGGANINGRIIANDFVNCKGLAWNYSNSANAQDLDINLSAGFYSGTNPVNAPTGITHYLLMIETKGATTDYSKQTLTVVDSSNGTTGLTYTRVYVLGGWTAWSRLAFADEVKNINVDVNNASHTADEIDIALNTVVFFCNNSINPTIITMPEITGDMQGKKVVIIKNNDNALAVTATASGTDLIYDGLSSTSQSSAPLTSPFARMEMYPYGNRWHVGTILEKA